MKEKVEIGEKASILNNNVLVEMIESEVKYHSRLVLLGDTLTAHAGKDSLLSKLNVQIKYFIETSILFQKNANEATTEANLNQRVILRKQRVGILKAFFTSYKTYSQLHQEYLAEIARNPRKYLMLDNILIAAKNPILGSLLIEPIQRGPRYQMLVLEAIKNKQNFDDLNISEFQELAKIIPEILIEINRGMTILPPPQKKQGVHWSGFFCKVNSLCSFGSASVAESSSAVALMIQSQGSSLDSSFTFFNKLEDFSPSTNRPVPESNTPDRVEFEPEEEFEADVVDNVDDWATNPFPS